MSLNVQNNVATPQNSLTFGCKGAKQAQLIIDSSSFVSGLKNPATAPRTPEEYRMRVTNFCAERLNLKSMRRSLANNLKGFFQKNIFSYKKEVTVKEIPENAAETLDEMAFKKPLKVRRTFQIHLGHRN